MKKLILFLILFTITGTGMSQQPSGKTDTASYRITKLDSITAKFTPNFNVKYWAVAYKDTNSGIAVYDSLICKGQNLKGDTVILGMRPSHKDTVVTIMVWDTNIPATPYQTYWVNNPLGLKSIWVERINALSLTNRKTWVDFIALRNE